MESAYTFETFKAEYLETLTRLMGYSPKQAGCKVLAEKAGELADAYPEWAERVEAAL